MLARSTQGPRMRQAYSIAPTPNLQQSQPAHAANIEHTASRRTNQLISPKLKRTRSKVHASHHTVPAAGKPQGKPKGIHITLLLSRLTRLTDACPVTRHALPALTIHWMKLLGPRAVHNLTHPPSRQRFVQLLTRGVPNTIASLAVAAAMCITDTNNTNNMHTPLPSGADCCGCCCCAGLADIHKRCPIPSNCLIILEPAKQPHKPRHAYAHADAAANTMPSPQQHAHSTSILDTTSLGAQHHGSQAANNLHLLHNTQCCFFLINVEAQGHNPQHQLAGAQSSRPCKQWA
ncbi:hypothetical protein COO60DRAFT_196558 [Scenedesmus sp. NREL 46B-D3]|nr:hypothetical protein COO60DRAFT_196558 [Scenedesmus sp. NREL 46B-D3]